MTHEKSLTYSDYLRLDGLLAQQQPLSQEHDELLFIVIHQVYELWFKQCLHELRFLREAFAAGDTPRVLATFKRILTILKTLVSQVDVLETMTPLSFNAFRSRLQASSGFQSYQFRAVEFLLGHKRGSALENYPPDSRERAELRRLLGEPSVYDAFLRYLHAGGAAMPAAALARDPAQATAADPQVQDALLAVYRSQPFQAQVCERLVDLDEGLQEWRYRHVKMVERTIGAKPGSGGSSGASYLRETLFKPLFPDLWAIRAQL
ncbi:MAG TPA: tryptophan 2,3-dioxygenase family protein [Nevskia sp.]|nr:tryptophan 2,3-dioxygenase family protein [Nevskia sp.]